MLCVCVPVHTLDVSVVFKQAKTAREGDRVPSFCLSFCTSPSTTVSAQPMCLGST